jgi:ectoine hydroxylase-related dioxygenase (phytanoyl-CoA dioxygenase family)
VVTPTGPITSSAQRQEFSDRGFVFTGVLFAPDELEPIRRECLRLYAEAIERARPSSVQERVRPFLPEAHARSAVIAEFARHPVFQALGREMVGPDVDQAWNQVCLKLPDEGDATTFPFHQDSKFAKVDYRTGGIGCFLGLGPLTVENGTLHFAAKAQGSCLDHAWNARVNWWECNVDAFEVVPGVCEPGQMVLYHPMTPHGSPPNRTPVPREAFLLAFGPPDIRLADTGELFGDQRPLLRGGQLVG